MSGHHLVNNQQSITPHASESSPQNDEPGLDDQHDQAQPTDDNLATPDSLNTDSASETLVYVDHPLRFSPTISNPEAFSPYNYSSGSSQQYTSPCMRLAPNVHLGPPFLMPSSPPEQNGHHVLPWRSPLTLPFRRLLDRQLKAALSLPSSSFASSPAGSVMSTDRQKNESPQVVRKLRPDQLGFSEFGFTPLPLTAPPSNKPRHSRKLSDSRDAQALLTGVARLFAAMDAESRTKFAADIGEIVGSQKYEEGLREDGEDAGTRREEEGGV